jgi:hypothetical protein
MSRFIRRKVSTKRPWAERWGELMADEEREQGKVRGFHWLFSNDICSKKNAGRL